MRLMFARNILPNFESYTVKSYTFIVEDFFFLFESSLQSILIENYK